MHDVPETPPSSRGARWREAVSKVPEITLGFWIIKIAATTLGETGGDWVTMSLNLGYVIGTLIFAVIFMGLVTAQVRAGRFRPYLYWATVVGTTTLGTTIADFADRSLGLGYPGGVALVATLLVISLVVWHRSEGTVSFRSIVKPRVEWFYWVTILFSQTLGTALGDWLAGDERGGLGLGYENGALVFGAGLAVVAFPTSVRASRARCCSGQPSSSLDPWVRPWETSWTSRWHREGST